MVRALRVGVPAALLVGMIAVAGWTLGEIYSGPLLFRLVAGAGLASVLLALVVRPLPAWTTAPVSVLGLAGYLAFAVNYSAQQAGVPAALLDNATDALANGIPRLLTAMVPIEPQPDSVAIPVIAAWIAGLTAAELAGRGRALPALAPPTILYGASLFLVGPHRAGVWAAVSFAGLALAALATSERRTPSSAPVSGKLDAATRRALQVRAAVAALAGVAAIVAVAALMGPGLSAAVTRRPADPRAYMSPPQLDALDQNPLIRLSGWAVNPNEHLLDATLTQDSPIRLAVLTAYDGITWHVSGEYRPAARTLPRPAAPPTAVAAEDGTAITPGSPVTVGQKITVAGLTGKLLPAAATPRRVDGVRVSMETASGTLLFPDGLHAGMAYEVTSQTSVPDDNTLPMADVPTGPSVAGLLTLGSSTPPERMRQLAEQLADDNSAAYARALAIEQFLAVHYRLDAAAPSGHALPNLDFFLFGAPNGAGGGGKGTSEQFAAAFAVLARMMGLPSRVVVGFQGRKGPQEILAKDASAWPEVLFAGVGWVPFDPLPKADQQPEPLESRFRPQPPPSSDPPSQDLIPTQSAAFSPSAARSGSESAQATDALPVIGASAGGLLVLILAGSLITIVMARKALRRRRLTEGVPAQRIAGAWLEVTDALRLAGSRGPEHLAATEVAAHARDIVNRPDESAGHIAGRVRLPAPALDELAQLVNAAEFGGGQVTEQDAMRAGAGATAYAQELRSRRSWWRRLLWTVHPGPLRWHRRS
jgi:transglutaminase-like putative cysteine protease